MDDKNIVGYMVSKDGEKLHDVYEGDRLLRAESINHLGNDKKNDVEGFFKWNIENFIKMNTREVHLWLNDLNAAERAFLFSIVPYVSYDDCHLRYTNGVDIGSEDIAVITGMSRRLAYQTIETLIQKDILYKGKNSKNRQYYANPWIFCKGNKVNAVLKSMFKNYKIRSLGGVKWQDLK